MATNKKRHLLHITMATLFLLRGFEGAVLRTTVPIAHAALSVETEKAKVAALAPERKKRRKELPRLKLNGIIDIMGRKIAIINDTVIREGDMIEKHRIVRIDDDRVITVYRRKERILKIEDLVEKVEKIEDLVETEKQR